VQLHDEHPVLIVGDERREFGKHLRPLASGKLAARERKLQVIAIAGTSELKVFITNREGTRAECSGMD
jgi:hypothetical protein